MKDKQTLSYRIFKFSFQIYIPVYEYITVYKHTNGKISNVCNTYICTSYLLFHVNPIFENVRFQNQSRLEMIQFEFQNSREKRHAFALE